MKILLLASAAILGSLALGGCVTATKYAAQVAVADDGDCRSYGAEPGSPAYFQCRMTKSQSHEYVAAVQQQRASEQMNRGFAIIAANHSSPAMAQAIMGGY